MQQVAISITQTEIYNFTHFPVGTTNSIKNSIGCVIVIMRYGGNPYLGWIYLRYPLQHSMLPSLDFFPHLHWNE